jgi:epoxyqueuosine reductase
LPVNEKVAEKEPYFRLPRLLHMDRGYFESHIWSHMFYMPSEDLWRWKMNVARVMGNTVDEGYVPDLVKAFEENGDERVKGMVAWALGRIGGRSARCALDRFRSGSEGIVREEIEMALCD